MNQDQARAIAGGLHAASVGDIYPLCVVGIGNGERVHYEIHNLQKDTVLQGPGIYGGRPWRSVSAYPAQLLAELIAQGHSVTGKWAPRVLYKCEVPTNSKPLMLFPGLSNIIDEQIREQQRRATDGNTVEPEAHTRKPVHGGYPDTQARSFYNRAAIERDLADSESWPAPGVSRYA